MKKLINLFIIRTVITTKSDMKYFELVSWYLLVD